MTDSTLNPFLNTADALYSRESARLMFEALGKRAARAHVTLRPPPPEPATCCGRGCNGCVWEGYFAAVAWWEEDARAALSSTINH